MWSTLEAMVAMDDDLNPFNDLKYIHIQGMYATLGAFSVGFFMSWTEADASDALEAGSAASEYSDANSLFELDSTDS